jgi:hypothetical protein
MHYVGQQNWPIRIHATTAAVNGPPRSSATPYTGAVCGQRLAADRYPAEMPGESAIQLEADHQDRPSPVDDDGLVPDWMRRFDPRDERWHDPADDGVEWADGGVCRRRRWNDARCVWAVAHGFDVAAVHGTKPGHDWWGFPATVGRETVDPAAVTRAFDHRRR